MRLTRFAAALATCLAAAALPAHAGYTLQDISGGGQLQFAADINNLGQVVGSGAGPGGLGWDGYFYSAATGVLNLETQPPVGTTGPIHSRGAAINDAGQVAGLWDPDGSAWRAFTKNPGGPMVDLPLAGNVAVGGIDRQGRVSGLIDYGGDPAANQVWVHTPGVGTTVTSPVSGVMGVAGTLANGNLVGTHYASDALPYGGTRAAVLQGDTWVDLAMPARATASQANALNANGVVVGSVETPYVELKTWLTSAGAWVDGRYVDIGAATPMNEWSSDAFAVSDAGVVLGRGYLSWDGSGDFHYLYDLTTGTFTNLASVLDTVAAAGWSGIGLSDINDAGQIVGSGLFEGQRRAFLLSPNLAAPVPEPGALLMLGAGLAAVVGATRRRRRPACRAT